MRNKGFFWFLTIVLTAVCIYQLSFTLVASNVEKDAAKEAAALAEDLKKETFAMDSTEATLPNNTRVDFTKPESFELAKAAFLNQVLAERAEVEEFFRDKVASSMDGVEQIMTKRINQFGVAQPNIQRDARMNRLFIELQGVQDEKTVADKLQSTANLQFFETYNLEEIQGPLTQANVMSRQAEIKLPEEDTTTVTKDSTELARLDSIKKAEAASKPIAAANPNQKALFDMLTPAIFGSIGTATAENRNPVDRILNRGDIKALFPPDLKLMWSAEMEESGKSKKMAYTLYACKIPEDGKAMVGGTDIAEAFVSRNQDKQETTVNLRMTPEGTGKWSEMTAKNAPQNRSIAITMDNIVFSAPRVINPINDGNTEITGGFTIEKAQDLVGLLNHL